MTTKIQPLTVGDFHSVITELVHGAGSVRAVFVTYNAVHGYKRGSVKTGTPRLNIIVQSGDLAYTPAVYSLVSQGIEELGSEYTGRTLPNLKRQMESEAHHAFERAIQDLEVTAGLDEKLIVFIYTGLSGFHGSTDLACQIRRDHPTATIILTMCDCGWGHHQRALCQLAEEGVANHLIITPECGGDGLMRDLLKSLIRAVPDASISPS